jgi:hypothetical protein
VRHVEVESAKEAWHAAMEVQESFSGEWGFQNGCYLQGQFDPLLSDSGNCEWRVLRACCRSRR